MIMFLFFFIEWFYNHPALRYGGYCLITILFFFPFSFFLEKYENSLREKKYKFIILICLVFIVFIGRNISRINDEVEKVVQIIKDINPSHIIDFMGQGMVAQSWNEPSLWYSTNIVKKAYVLEEIRKLKNFEKYVSHFI